MSQHTKLFYAVGVGIGTTIISSAAVWLYNYLRSFRTPQKWRRVGTLAQINLFPVKSCAALELDADTEVECDVLGLRIDFIRDRTMMLIDDESKMVTARVYPKMVNISTKKTGDTSLEIASPNMPEKLLLDLSNIVDEEGTHEDVQTNVWGSPVTAMHCGDRFDRWFSQAILGQSQGLRLVYYYRDVATRPTVKRMEKEPFLKQSDSGAFGDATSYMLMNLASVDELNTRIARPASAQQFRGNFHLLMDENEPYAEDHWRWVRIGEKAVFRVVAPCTRCIFPNINVVTGERDPEGEPLKTLRTYRMKSGYGSPALGIHLGLRQAGNVKLNDVVYVEDD